MVDAHTESAAGAPARRRQRKECAPSSTASAPARDSGSCSESQSSFARHDEAPVHVPNT